MPLDPLRVQLAGEDAAQELLLLVLSDAALCESLEIAPGDTEALDHYRQFLVGEKMPHLFLTSQATRRLQKMLKKNGRPFYRRRRLGGEPAGSAAELMDAIDCILLEQEDVECILMLVDADGSKERAQDVRRAQHHYTQHRIVILIGLCVPTAEGWLVPMVGQGKPLRVQQLKKTLKFDPTRTPHRMASKPKTSLHLAKRVLHAILDPKERPLAQQPSSTPHRDVVQAALEHMPAELPPLLQLRDCGLGDFVETLQQRYTAAIQKKGS